MVEYAVYKGDELLFLGTVKEIAKEFNVKSDTVWYWASSVNKRRLASRRGGNSKGKLAVKVEKD